MQTQIKVKEKPVKIKVRGKLKSRILDFCMDELDYHINESGCADEYHDEILAQIELLCLLGQRNQARMYTNAYDHVLQDNTDDIEARKMRKQLKKLWVKVGAV